MEDAFLVGYGIFVLALYFLPAVIAWERGHRFTLVITAVCLLTGWTVLGWMIALIWSLTGTRRTRHVTVGTVEKWQAEPGAASSSS
jgi:hypothetical protein